MMLTQVIKPFCNELRYRRQSKCAALRISQNNRMYGCLRICDKAQSIKKNNEI